MSEIWTAENWLKIATRFFLTERISIARRTYPDDQESWAVVRGDSVLNHELEWEYEPMPSSRDEAFFNRCRYHSKEEAMLFYLKAQQKEAE